MIKISNLLTLTFGFLVIVAFQNCGEFMPSGSESSASSSGGGGGDAPDDLVISPAFLGDEARFGIHVHINSLFMAVAAPDDDGNTARSGAVHMYRRVRTPNGEKWLTDNKFSYEGNEENRDYGYSLDLDVFKIIIGDPVGRGSVEIYERVGQPWFVRPQPTLPQGESAKRFGEAVAIEGNIVLVGALEPTSVQNKSLPVVYVYELDPQLDTINYIQRIDARDAVSESNTINRPIVLDVDEGILYIGFPNDGSGDGDRNMGAVFAFKKNEGLYEQIEVFNRDVPIVGDGFGYAMEFKGNIGIIGAPGVTDAGDSNSSNGAVYVYRRSGENWDLDQILVNPHEEGYFASEFFGRCVGADPTRGEIIVGGLARATQFKRYSNGWRQVRRFKKDENNSQFGFGCDLRGGYITVGEPLDEASPTPDRGRVYLYDRR